jgi:hypothetical protein
MVSAYVRRLFVCGEESDRTSAPISRTVCRPSWGKETEPGSQSAFMAAL